MNRFLIGMLFLGLAGCAAGASSFRKGEDLVSAGDFDQAIVAFADAAAKNPDKAEYRMRLAIARHKAALEHERKANELLARQDYRSALREFQIAIGLDGSLESSVDGAREAGQYIKVVDQTLEASKFVRDRHFKQARQLVDEILATLPAYAPALALRAELDKRALTMIDGIELEVTSNEPITLNFKSASLPDVFDILTQLSGIRFILDDAIRTQTTTLYLEGATFGQAFELLLRMNKLDKKILNTKTIILFPNSKDKQKQFADQIIQTFYLSNIDAKKAVNLLRTMLQVRKIYVHEELNAIVLRDTPEVVRLAQKIIEANDRATSEVVFDLELVEVNHQKELDLGVKLSEYSVSVGASGQALVDPATAKISSIVVGDLKNLSPLYSIPFATFDFRKQNSDGEILASPKIRLKDGSKAKVHIGSREPIVTTSNNANGDVTSTNIQYVDVGVKVDLEAKIQLDNTVLTKVGLEVSNKGVEVPAGDNVAFAISTTNATTELILKDGEQTILGGLLRDDESKTKTGIPILSDIPLLGALFTSYTTNKTKREILLSITPHIVRTLKLPESDIASIWSGGEDDLRVGKNFGSFADEYLEGQGKTTPRTAPARQFRSAQTSLPTPAEAVADALMDQPPSAPAPAGMVPPPSVDIPPTDNNVVPEQAELLPLQPEAPPEIQPPLPVEIPVAQPETAAPPVPVEILPGLQTPDAVVRPAVFIEGDRLVSIGNTFTMTLAVQDVKDLFSAPLYIRFDPKLVEFVSASEGTFLQQGGGSTIFTSTLMADSGRVIIGLKQGAGGSGVSGGGDLARLEFRGLAPGKLSIAPERINFRNPAGERLPIDSRGLIVEVK